MRHVVRTQRIDIDWLFERVRDDPGVFMKYVRTLQQMADLLTKASFTSLQWKALCSLCSMGPRFSLRTEKSGTSTEKSGAGPVTLKGRKSKPPNQKSAGQLQAAPTPTLTIEKKRQQDAVELPSSLSSTSSGKKLKASTSFSNQGSTKSIPSQPQMFVIYEDVEKNCDTIIDLDEDSWWIQDDREE